MGIRWLPIAALVTSCRSSPGQLVDPASVCHRLDEGPVTARAPFISGAAWYDAATVVVSLSPRVVDNAIDVDPSARGIVVVDVVRRRIVRAFRGLDFVQAARRHDASELLLAGGGYTDNPEPADHQWRDWLATLDLSTGCTRKSQHLTAQIAIDSKHDTFLVSRYGRIERWPATTLQPAASHAIERPQATNLVFDLAHDRIVAIYLDMIATYDTTTLDRRDQLTFDVSLDDPRLDGDQLMVEWKTRCTLRNPRAMHVECIEQPQQRGLLTLATAPLREVARVVGSQPNPRSPTLRWSPDHARSVTVDDQVVTIVDHATATSWMLTLAELVKPSAR